MLQQINLLTHAANRPVTTAASPVPNARSLIGQLRAAGCEPLVSRYDLGYTGGGKSMRLSVRELLHSQGHLDNAAQLIREQVLAKSALTITLCELGSAEESVQVLETFCSKLHDAGVPRSRFLNVCLGTPSLPPRAFSLITRCWLGAGARYAMLGSAEFQQFNTGLWDYLWRFREGRWAVLPAYAEVVATPCPLLADEAANALLPTFGVQAPAGTAWLPIRLHLPRFANQRGELRIETLDQALFSAVSVGEQLLDLLRWPDADMNHDAKSNRRIAIHVTGFGDLVRLQKRIPSDFRVLQSLLQIGKHIQTTVWEHSANIACQTELLPAIAKHEPSIASPDAEHSRIWAARWQAAVDRSAVRHRNLLVMSPYSVVPEDDAGCAAYTDLLPVIGFADAYSFAGAPPLRSWNLRGFCHFHRRARAVMQHRFGVSLIASGA